MFLLKDNLIASPSDSSLLSTLSLDWALYGCVILMIALLCIYFEISWLIKVLERIPFISKFSYFIQKLEDFGWRELLKVLVISLIRYSVFVVQYLLLLQVFNVGISVVTSLWLITVMFLALAIVPTIALAELGVRGKISIFLFGIFSTNTIGIVLTASTIWLINLVAPALAGSLFVLGVKLYRK